VKHGRDLLVDGPFEVLKILVDTLSFAFAFSYQQCTSSLDTIANQKQFEKCQTTDFPS
jgi:hypothetical protein